MTSGVNLASISKTLSGTYSYVYGPASSSYAITNLGTVAATGNRFPGAIYLKQGGVVTNASTAVVAGYGSNAGIAIVGAAGAVTNFGAIDGGTAGRGVELYDGGSLVNGSAGDTLATIRGHGGRGAVFVNATTSGIPNGGTTTGGGGGNGIVVAAGLTSVAASTVINYGTIGSSDGRDGIVFSTIAGAATVINGSTADTSALILDGPISGAAGIYIGQPGGGSIVNFGTIGGAAGRGGIYLGPLAGAVTIDNGSTADQAALIAGGAAAAPGCCRAARPCRSACRISPPSRRSRATASISSAAAASSTAAPATPSR